MVKALFASCIVGAIAGGKLAVTWSDCGDASTHGHITDLQPTEITIGEDGALTGTGTIDEQLTDGSFTIQLTASLGIKETFTGKACESKTFKLPLNLGTVTWGGLDCPVAAGTITQKVGFTMASIVPAAFATADISAKAIDQNGNNAVCLSAHLERKAELSLVKKPEDMTYDAYGNGTMVKCSEPAPHTCTFYEQCMEASHPCGDKGYALDYGAYFCNQFKNRLGNMPAFPPSCSGNKKLEAWMWATNSCLQKEMVKVLQGNDDLSCQELHDKAFESHVKCYTESGFCDLCVIDYGLISTIIGLKGMFADGSLMQMLGTLKTCMQPSTLSV